MALAGFLVALGSLILAVGTVRAAIRSLAESPRPHVAAPTSQTPATLPPPPPSEVAPSAQVGPSASPASPNPPPPPPPTSYQYHVHGTCPTGGCVLFVRAGPGYSNYAQTGLLHEGDAVQIVCQARGETVSESGWGTSSVWDKLTNGSWVTDLYVNTPNVNQFSPPIPQC